MRTKILIVMLAGSILPVMGQDQKPDGDQKLTARQMFYGEQDDTAAPAKPKPPKPPVKTAARPVAKPKPPEATATSKPTNTPVHGGDVIPASYSPTPLGLRYTLRKRAGDQTTDTSPNAVFHSGDHIALGLEVNDAGYLYIISQGTSGTWNVLFPSPDFDNGDNRVQKGPVYAVPPRGVFTFTGNPGVEKLFVIFSRQPEQDIEGLIYSLKGGDSAAGEQDKPKPASGPERPASKVMLASVSPVDNALIERIRNVYARDLIVEKVDEEQPGKRSDKAVYVVNPKGSADSRVVADIALTHE